MVFDSHPFQGKTFLIFHYRVGLTDGVSLEIGVWKKILEDLGGKVLLCAGPGSLGADFIIPRFSYHDDLKISTLDAWAFGRDRTSFKNEQDFENQFTVCSDYLKKEFTQVLDSSKADWVIVSNVFSLGENLPAALALAEVLKTQKKNSLLIHHDFIWDHPRSATPTSSFVQNILDTCCPPRDSRFEHACINTIARDELYFRKGIRAMIITDSANFNRPLQDRGAKCKYLLGKYGIKPNDLIILQATRVIPRKAIEVAIDFVQKLSTPGNLKILQEKGLYNGRGFDPKSDSVILLLAGYAEKQDQAYLNQILRYAKTSRVKCIFLNGAAGAFSPEDRSATDQPTLLDLYIYASLVTYPSIREGFGNQFLEAVLSKTPIVMFEYPVYIKDIKPKGFKIISLGDIFTKDPNTSFVSISSAQLQIAVNQAVETLTTPDLYSQIVDHNYHLGKIYYSSDRIGRIFRWIFSGTWIARKVGYHREGKQLPLVARKNMTR